MRCKIRSKQTLLIVYVIPKIAEVNASEKECRSSVAMYQIWSLLSFAGREMSSGSRAVMLCGWEVKAGWLIA